MSRTTSIDFNTFAFNVGEQSRKTRDASLPLHKAYTKAEPEQQRDLRTRWMLNHLRGALAVTAKTAERILSEGKGAGAKPEHIKAIDKASSDFRYHIARPEAKPAQPTSHARLAPATRKAAQAYLAQFDSLADAIAALRAVSTK